MKKPEYEQNVIGALYGALCQLRILRDAPHYTTDVAEEYRVPVADAVTSLVLALCLLSGASAEEVLNTVEVVITETGERAH